MDLYLKGVGGCEEVGRSGFLLDIKEKILLDYGIKLASDQIYYPSELKTNIAAAIISHAHLDHSGNVPYLFTKAPVLCYMTVPTLAVSEVLWNDTLKIAKIEKIKAKYTKNEVKTVRYYTFNPSYRNKLPVTEHCMMEFFDAGHIIGSAMVKLDFFGKTLLYTADFNPIETRLLRGADVDIKDIDYIITESTYGTTDHEKREEIEKRFINAIKETIDNNGSVIIPAFAVGRSQEIIDILYDYKIKENIYLDGMGQKIADISLRYKHYLKKKSTFEKALKKTIWVSNDNERKRVIREGGIIVTTAGMLEGGPVHYYIKHLHNDKNSALFLTGYQVEGTPGYKLLRSGTIVINNIEYMVKCRIEKFDFSAHVGKTDMLKCFKGWNPKEIFLAHGDREKILEFASIIKEDLGVKATVLKTGEKYPLD